MPATRNHRTARDENRSYELSCDTKLERPEPKNNTWPRPNNRKTALEEFTKRCPEERCKACCSSRYPGLYYSHCPLCKYDATDAEDYTRHLQDHIEDTRFFVERKNANGKIERIAYYRCILQNCQRKDGKRHVGRQARNLAGHATTFIGNCPHKCHYCDDRFSDQSPRSKHERAQHSQLPEYIAKKAAYEAAKAAARANGQDFVNDETYEEEKQKTRKKRGSPKRANKDEVFASVPQSVRRARSADRQAVAGPSSGSPSRLFAPHPSRSSRRYNTASSAPVADTSLSSFQSYEFATFNEAYLSSSSPSVTAGDSLAGAASEPLVNPANDKWPSSCPPEDADLYLHNPYAFSFPQTPMPAFNESFDPAFFAPPVPDSLIDPELLNAPQPYPQPAVQFPTYDASSNGVDPVLMAYLTDPSFAAAQEQWPVSPWDAYNFNNLPQNF